MKVGLKGQIVIPKVFRDEFNISPGDEIIMRDNENKLVLEKPKDPVNALRNIAKTINFNKKIDPHIVEEEYDEKWKKQKFT